MICHVELQYLYFCINYSQDFLKSKKNPPEPSFLKPSSFATPTKRNRLSADIARYLRPEEIAPVDVNVREYPNGLRVMSERVTGASSLAVGL
jgi:hypothetical protein